MKEAILTELEDMWEPLRQHRWVFETERLNSFSIASISSLVESGELILVVDYQVLKQDDITSIPNGLWRSAEGKLKFLDRDGTAHSTYSVTGVRAECIPFVRLDYQSSDPVLRRFRLIGATLTKDEIQ